MTKFKNIFIWFNLIRFLPVVFILIKNKNLVELDVKHWTKRFYKSEINGFNLLLFNTIKLLIFRPPFRNLFYYRCKKNHIFLIYIQKIFCKPFATLYITSEEIGYPFVLQHGFSTIISAKKIGNNCSINQQVTVGYSNETDVPSNCTVVGVPAYIVKKDGKKVNIKL